MFDHFDLLAPIFDRAVQPPDVSRFVQLLELPAEGCLLDAGGGTGRISNELRMLVDDVMITDVSGGMLRRAAAKDGLHVSQARAERLPFPDESFCRVIVVDALHHFRDQQMAMTELVRVLKYGGRLLIQEPDISYWQVKLIAAVEKIALMRSRFYSPNEIREMAVGSGCRVQVRAGDRLSSWILVEK